MGLSALRVSQQWIRTACAMSDTPHEIDATRTKVHDFDRVGNFYSAWCTCGVKIAHKLPHFRKNPSDHPGCRDTVEDALDAHRKSLNISKEA